MSPVTTSLTGSAAISKIGSVGKPIPTISARVVDDEMNDVAPGEVGEIVYRGPPLMAGYWNNPGATAEAFAGGWFHSGDLVRADGEGFLYVVDRKKDLILRGGFNVFPRDIEDVLLAHPAVAHAAAVGKPDPVRTQIVKAFVVLRAGVAPGEALAREIQDFVRTRLSAHEYPREIAFRAGLPLTATGKVVRRLLRDEA